jgi:hypothetical protein
VLLFYDSLLNDHRPEQARGEQFVLALIELVDIRLGESFLGRKLSIADQPIRPEVDDVDLQVVAAGLHSLRNVDLPGRAPDRTEVFAVESDVREVVDDTEGEGERRVVSDQ